MRRKESYHSDVNALKVHVAAPHAGTLAYLTSTAPGQDRRAVHEHWRSPDECVSHILWMLTHVDPTHSAFWTPRRKKHASAINRAFTSSLCSCCVSILLSHVSFDKLLSKICMNRSVVSASGDYRQVLPKLIGSFLFYPKGFTFITSAIAMASAEDIVSHRIFDLMCMAALVLRETTGVDSATSMRALFLTMRHWTHHNHRVFVQNYLMLVEERSNICRKR